MRDIVTGPVKGMCAPHNHNWHALPGRPHEFGCARCNAHKYEGAHVRDGVVIGSAKGNKDDAAKTRVIYLSGPMTGYPHFNYPQFNAVATWLRGKGHTVYNPAEFKHDGDTFPLREAFAEYTTFISLKADCVVLLPAYAHSKGACAERALAEAIGLDVLIWPQDF